MYFSTAPKLNLLLIRGRLYNEHLPTTTQSQLDVTPDHFHYIPALCMTDLVEYVLPMLFNMTAVLELEMPTLIAWDTPDRRLQTFPPKLSSAMAL
jgi:hypothetical protein